MSRPLNRALGLALPALLMLAAPCHAGRVITDFAETPGPDWVAVNDGVMGGLSQGQPVVGDGVMTFQGTISLENNGGFSSCRTRKTRMDLSDFDGLLIELKPDARKYRLTIESARTPRFVQLQYWADLNVEPGVWQTVRVPFKDFYPTTFGRRLPLPRLDTSAIDSVGFMLYDKKAGPFALKCRRIVAFNKGEAAPEGSTTKRRDPKGSNTGSNTIVDVAARAGAFKTLLAAARAAGLAGALAGDGPFTVLAPTDEAFAKIPAERLQALLKPENRGTLAAILKFHVIPGRAGLADVVGQRRIATLNGQSVRVRVRQGRVRVGGATILTADVGASNGVIHVIDRVLIPETRTIVGLAADQGSFKTLIAAAKAAGLAGALSGEGPLTVFAPTDEAFAKLPKGLVAKLLKPVNKPALVRLLTHHVVKGKVDAATAIKAGEAKTLAGTTLSFGLAKGRVTVAGTNLVLTDLGASNGVIHVVDAVLIPKDFKLTEDKRSRPGRRLVEGRRIDPRGLIAAAIEKGVPLFNAGRREACRDIYAVAAKTLAGLGQAELDSDLRARLRQAAAPRHGESAGEQAWRLRRALDAAWTALESRKPQPGRDRALY